MRTRPGGVVGGIFESDLVEAHTPHLCDVEVASILRRGLLMGRLDGERASQALRDLADLPIRRHAHGPLLPRALDLHANFTAYDAIYLALAEGLGAGLVTGDSRLARGAEAALQRGRLNVASVQCVGNSSREEL